MKWGLGAKRRSSSCESRLRYRWVSHRSDVLATAAVSHLGLGRFRQHSVVPGGVVAFRRVWKGTQPGRRGSRGSILFLTFSTFGRRRDKTTSTLWTLRHFGHFDTPVHATLAFLAGQQRPNSLNLLLKLLRRSLASFVSLRLALAFSSDMRA